MRLWTLPILLMIVCPSLSAQSPTATQPTAPVTIRTQAKLVAVDVVVTDRDHHPVHDLTRQDFSVLENSEPQTINSFAEVKSSLAAPLAKLPSMPPGFFTNVMAAPSGQAINILLLDALNTPMADQNYLHQQLLEFLKKPHTGNMAIFGLSSKLVLLQGFTSDPEVLKDALAKQTAKSSRQLTDVIGGNGTVDTADDVNTSMDGILSTAQVAALQSWLDMQQSFQTMVRVKDTLDAMDILARWLATIPGRKNLIWFSGSFPLNILPDATQTSTDAFAGVADAADEYRETSDLLARAQVAVYPIDVRGLMVAPSAGGALAGTKGVRTANGHGNPLANDNTQFFMSSTDEHATMQRMAEDTGGHAFFNTNGLVDAVNKALDDGSSFYSITYRPTNAESKGDFRRIEVKLARQGYTLEYRKGYYADAPGTKTALGDSAATPDPGAKVDSSLIVKAMVHAVPGATQVLYRLHVTPSSNASEDAVAQGNIFNENAKSDFKPPFRRYNVDFTVLPSSMTFTRTPDGKYHAVVAFVSIVYDNDGVLVNRISRAVPATLTAEQFQQVVQTGFSYHQEISVPVKGSYSIRTGVHDIRSNRIGSTEIPVAAVSKLAPPAAAPPSQP